MRPYKVVIGCTQFLQASPGFESINFQLYSYSDLSSLRLSVHQLYGKLNEVLVNSDKNLPKEPPEVFNTLTNLPYVNFSILLPEPKLKTLGELLEKVFPKNYYIEVE